jgi:two-component system sensor histidine kinase NblS
MISDFYLTENKNLIIENLFDGVILLNLDLKILYINSKAIKLLNLNYINDYEINFLNFFSFEFKELFIKKLKNLIFEKKEKKTRNYKEILLNSTNNFNKIILLTLKFTIKEKKVVGIFLIIKDISKKIKINKKKANFLSNISHELRTPLFNIKSFIEIIYKNYEKLKKNEIKELLFITNKEILRLNNLVNSILEVSKLNYKNSTFFDFISLNDIFNDVIEINLIRLNQKKIIIKKEIEKDLFLILGKKELLFQVFENLLANAVTFSNITKIIVFRCYKIKNKDKNKIRIEIGDFGIGIAKENQKNIFRRFSRLTIEKQNKYGKGLGLSLTKKILEKHNSKINYTTDFNEGIIFYIDFLY